MLCENLRASAFSLEAKVTAGASLSCPVVQDPVNCNLIDVLRHRTNVMAARWSCSTARRNSAQDDTEASSRADSASLVQLYYARGADFRSSLALQTRKLPVRPESVVIVPGSAPSQCLWRVNLLVGSYTG